MAEIVNWVKEHERDNMLAWVIISLMTEATEANRERGDEWAKKFDGMDSTKIEIECRINGVEVSFTKLVERINDQHDVLVREAAFKLAVEKFDGLYQAMDDAKRKLREVLQLGEER